MCIRRIYELRPGKSNVGTIPKVRLKNLVLSKKSSLREMKISVVGVLGDIKIVGAASAYRWLWSDIKFEVVSSNPLRYEFFEELLIIRLDIHW